MRKFNGGDPFPTLEAETVEHGRITLPDHFPDGHYGIVLAYRADW